MTRPLPGRRRPQPEAASPRGHGFRQTMKGTVCSTVASAARRGGGSEGGDHG